MAAPPIALPTLDHMERLKELATPLAYISAACLAGGSFLPWAKVTAPLIGSVTKSGIEGGDGWFTLAAAVVIAGLAATWTTTSRVRPFVMMAVAPLLGLLLFYEYQDIARIFGDVNSEFVATNYGAGLHLCSIGAFGAFVSAILRLEVIDDEAHAALVGQPGIEPGTDAL